MYGQSGMVLYEVVPGASFVPRTTAEPQVFIQVEKTAACDTCEIENMRTGYYIVMGRVMVKNQAGCVLCAVCDKTITRAIRAAANRCSQHLGST